MSDITMNLSDSISDASSITSKSSVFEVTPSSTPENEADDVLDTCKIGSKPLPALQRDFPQPLNEVDVESLLERQPGRWTIQGQIAANNQRAKTLSSAVTNEKELKERRAREFEAAKKDLRAFHGALQPARGSQW
ncbi:hypothetical protein BGZ63DRAFT_420103 [Mariannaea sp. PMI_226]|nr:hypothetical protein BGZ63DRAFT_420103 [Mariannaea sp. PMI_226]